MNEWILLIINWWVLRQAVSIGLEVLRRPKSRNRSRAVNTSREHARKEWAPQKHVLSVALEQSDLRVGDRMA